MLTVAAGMLSTFRNKFVIYYILVSYETFGVKLPEVGVKNNETCRSNMKLGCTFICQTCFFWCYE
jgi:hypothetical protein